MPNSTAVDNCKVFLFEPPRDDRIDVNSANEYGEITYLFQPEPGVKTRPGIWETEQLAEQVIQSLEQNGFDPTRDYICMAGATVPLYIMLATIVAEYGVIKTLLFDTRERCYVIRELGY